MARTKMGEPQVENAQHVNRNLLIAGAVLVACASLWLVFRVGSGDPTAGRETRTTSTLADSTLFAPPDTAGPQVAPTAPVAQADESEVQFQRYVDDKYRRLLHDVEGEAAVALQSALRQRERMVVQINTAKQGSDAALRDRLPALEARKAEIDRKIGGLLPASELGTFELLKDSDIERFQVEDYAAGIGNVAPLSQADQQSILDTKLAYRERFRRALADSRLMSGDLTGAERLLAFNEVSRALKGYQQDYLQEVSQYLYNDEQYALLSNYETTEYQAELAKLRGIAGLE